MKSKSKRILSIALVLCMLFTLLIPSVASAGTPTSDVTILYTNDVHTYLDTKNEVEYPDGTDPNQKPDNNPDKIKYAAWNYAKLAAYKQTFGDNVLLVDAGDHAQGTANGSIDKAASIVALMNAAGYDAATLGNHEFDYGMKRALEIAKGNIPYLSANFYHEANGVRGENVLSSYKIFEKGGVKVAIVGVTTPESFTKSTPAYFQDGNGNYIYGIAGGTDGKALYADVQKAITDARTAGADYVIGLGHLGNDPASQPWTSEKVIANTTGLDAFIDGHSHEQKATKTVKDKDNADVVLTQTGQYFSAVGKLTIKTDGTITAELIGDDAAEKEALPNYQEDIDVKALEDALKAKVKTELGQKVGHADVTFDNYADGERLVRKQETNTGDFAADALYYLFDNMDMDVDVAIMNGGGVRNGAKTGDLTYLDFKDIHAFGNVACLQTITGQQLLDALEWGAKDVDLEGTKENGGFLHVSGITYEINPYIESTVQKDSKNVWTGGPTGEYRVRNVKIYDKESGKYVPLDLKAKYNLAGYNYTLRDLGDGFAMFNGAVNVLDYVMEDYMVLANYVRSFPVINGLPTITAENSVYEDVNGSGRIVAKCSHDVVEVEAEGVVKATCIKDGYTGDFTCPTCGEEVKGEVVKALGHDYKDGKCTVCGVADPNAKVPETGDANQMGLYLLAMLIAAAGCTVAVKRRDY